MKTTTIKLTNANTLALLNCIESVFPENYTEEQNDELDRLHRRLMRALDRTEA